MALQYQVEIATVAISNDERAFFIELGARIASLRKEEGITQVQLAELLGTSQQTITAYEVGRRRVRSACYPARSRSLSVRCWTPCCNRRAARRLRDNDPASTPIAQHLPHGPRQRPERQVFFYF